MLCISCKLSKENCKCTEFRGEVYLPTLEEISEQCLKIQENWSERERFARRAFGISTDAGKKDRQTAWTDRNFEVKIADIQEYRPRQRGRLGGKYE